jgi:hypothetical protein
MTFIELRGGLLVREDAVRLALDLEARGHLLTTRDGTLRVTNGATLTAADTAAIKDTKRHLMEIAAYEAPEPR